MFKAFVSRKLRQSLGEFVDISNEQIQSLEITKAKVLLHNVPLKQTALRRFKCPVKVRSGSVGQITIYLPSLPLSTEAVITIENVELFVEFSEQELSWLRDDLHSTNDKRSVYDGLEEFHKMLFARKKCRLESALLDDTSANDPLTMIEVSNIRLVYSRDLSKDDLPKFVLSVDRLSFKNEEETLGVNANLFLFHVTGLAFGRAGLAGADACSPQPNEPRPWASGSKRSDEELHWLQISELKIRVEENVSLMAWNVLPERTFDIDMGHLTLRWTDSMLSNIVELISSFKWREFTEYKKFRPVDPVMKSPRDWWQFAATCILSKCRNRRMAKGWYTAYQRSKNLNTYCAAYARRIQQRELESDGHILERAEMDYSFGEINLFRFLAARRLFRSCTKGTISNWRRLLELSLLRPPEAFTRLCGSGSKFFEGFPTTGADPADGKQGEHDPLADVSYGESGQNSIFQLRLRVDALHVFAYTTERNGGQQGNAMNRLRSHELVNARSLRMVVNVSGLEEYVVTRTVRHCNFMVVSDVPLQLNVNRSACKQFAELWQFCQSEHDEALSAYVCGKYGDSFGMSSVGLYARLPMVWLNFQSDFAECASFATATMQDLSLYLRNDTRASEYSLQFDLGALRCYDNVNGRDMLVIRQIGSHKGTALRKWLHAKLPAFKDGDISLDSSGISEDDCSHRCEPSNTFLELRTHPASNALMVSRACLAVHYVRLSLYPDVWLILSDFVSMFIPSSGNAGVKWELTVEVQSYFAEVEIPYATDSRNCSILHLQDSRVKVTMDDVGFGISGSVAKLSLCDRPGPLRDHYLLKAELFAESHPLSFNFYKYRREDNELRRQFDGSLRLTSLDHLYFVVTSRFGLNMNSFFQMMADRYENFLQLRKRDSYTTRGSFGFRLHLHADINNVTFIVPESVVSSTVVLAKVRRLTLRSSAELRKADPSERQSVNGIAEHLIDTVVAHFESTEFVKALKRDDLSAFDKPYCSYGVEYFVIQKSLCKSDVDVEATFSRHLCPECLCRVNELNARVHSNVSQAICLHPEEVQMFRRLMKENVGEYVRFLEPRVNRETDLRAEFNMSPGTRVLVYLNSISLIFPTTPVEAGTGSITLRDLNVRLEICTYVRSRLSCTFFVDAFEMFARRTADNDPKAASEPCKRKLHSLTLGETKLPVEVTCHWNATRLSICCVVCDIRFVCMPTWLKAFMEYVLVNLCVNTGDSISNPKPPGLDGQAPDSFSVSCKLTLIGCQLYIGHSFDPESVAVLAKTSGSLQAACKQGIVTLEVLLDSIELFECQPYLNPSRSIPISNAFSAALSANTKLSHFHEYTLREGNFAKRRTEVSTTIRCDDVCMRVSLCDLLMLEKFIKAYYTKAAGSRPSVDNRRPIEYGSRIEIDRLTVVLVEYERSRQPIVRLSVQDAELEVQYAERRRKVWTVCGHFKLVSDFYNPNFGAWEPLVEELRVKDFLWIMNRISCCSSLLVYGIPRGSELTIMESTLRQLLQRYQQWPEYWEMASRSCSRIFTLPTAARCQVKNECGIPLWVAVRPYRAAVPDDAWVCAQPKKSEFLFYSVDYSREEVFHELIVRSLPRCESLAVSIRRAGSYCKPLVIPWLVNSDGQKPLEIEATVPVRCTVSVEGSGLHSVVISTALRLHNCLPFDLTVRLMPPSEAALAPMIVPVVHRSTFGVPINHWRSAISVAVVGKSCYSCPVDWQQVAAARPSRYAVECRRLASAKYIILSMNVTKRRFKGKWLCHGPNINEHLITLLPAALFINTLPYSATVKCETGGGTCNFTVPSGDSAPLLSVIDAGLLNVFLMVGEFESSKPFVVDLNPADHSVDNFSVPLLDCRKRLLNINVQTNMSASGCLEIVLKAPFMFVNRTNLAIIVKQVGADTLAAGQTDSHEEVAREEPLMFSFSDPEAPQRCHMRIGLRFGTVMEAPWCDHFPLVQGIAFRDLRVILDSGQVRIYHIGICIESMKGPSKGCLLVNFTCRYLLVNDSAHTVLVRQATQNSGPALRLPPNGHSVWHLPFPHLPPLISIQLAERTYWTEEFLVDQLTSFTLYLRGVDGITHFLLVEIVLEGAMFRVKFSSAYHLPPPITLLNMSCVPVTFHQKGCSAAHLRSTLLPRALSCYNWDNWLGQKQLVLSVYRAASLCFDFTKKRAVYNLSYGVQFYIAFGMQESLSDALVLEAKETGFVFLTSMNLEYGNQLWQETADGSLMNVGQSSRLQRSGSVGQLVVLDVDESEGSHSEPLLCVRRAESSRSETQRWTFDSNKLKLVSRNGFASVRSVDYFSSVFLASGSSNLVNNVFVRRCPTRPGSGALQVVVKADSPTHEVIISECCKPANGDDEALRDAAWLHPKVHNNRKLVERQRDRLVKVDDALLSCCFFIPDIGVSVVNERNEELMYFRFDDVAVNFIRTERVNKLSVQAYSIQGDNQLRNTNNWQFLQVHPELPEEMTKFKPALSLQIHWRFMPPLFDVQRAVVKLDRTVLQLEENLLWKLLDLFDLRRWAGTSCRSKANDWSRVQRKLDRLFYVEALCVSIRKLFLSVTTDTLLPKQLLQVKGEHGFNLVRFQNAPVNILPFQQVRCVQTFKFFTSALRSHFARTLRNQAMKIFGSVDFLGNPIGLFRELSGGIHELVIEGNLSGFVYGLWHGLSNSAARFTSALAEGVGIISMGSSNEFRTQLQLNSPQSAVEHLVDGMRGFGAGIFDGMTSLVSHAVDGAVDHGFQGLVTGIGRGLVGTVTRPVQGILALVSGAATAAKEAASKNAPLQPFFAPNRLRPARSTISFDLTVPRYDQTWVDVAALLFKERADKDSFDKQVLAVLRLNKADDVVTLFAACPRRYYVVECQRGTTKVIASNAYTEVCSCKLLFARANDSEKVCVVIVHNITNVELRQLEIDCPDEKTARTVLQLIEQGQRMYAGLSGALEAPVQLPCVCSGNRAELVD